MRYHEIRRYKLGFFIEVTLFCLSLFQYVYVEYRLSVNCCVAVWCAVVLWGGYLYKQSCRIRIICCWWQKYKCVREYKRYYFTAIYTWRHYAQTSRGCAQIV